MNNRNWTLGGIGLLVAVVAAAGFSACDPYIQANTDAPQILGVSVIDINFPGVPPSDIPGCVPPYPEVSVTWAQSVFPGTCLDTVGPSQCPVLCFPPRTGPLFAPYFTGNLGGSYLCQTTATNIKCSTVGSGGSYTYAIPATWVINNVPPTIQEGAQFSQIRITFNKMMQPTSIQASAAGGSVCTAAAGITVYVNDVASTADFDVCYAPNASQVYAGASMTVTPSSGDPLAENSRYRITGTVQDQQGNSLPVDVLVTTGVSEAAPAP
jgi:hypothetical protein